MKQIDISEASKSFGNTKILSNASIQIPFGKIIGLFGRNGSGKSTLLRLIFGSLQADSIKLLVDGVHIKPHNVIASQQIAYLPQDSFLPKELHVRKIIPLLFPNGDDQDAIFYAKGVASFEKQLIGKLSIGQLRYLELLLIGNMNHSYLMLDEPFSMIEPLYKDIIKDYLSKLKKQKGIILTDHYYDDVLEITDTNYILKDGLLKKINSQEDLFKYEYLKRIDS